MPDHPRGYVKQGQTLPPDPDRADLYRRSANDEPVTFDIPMLTLLHSGVIDIAQRRDWRIHAVFGEPTHFHVVLSWADQTRPSKVYQVVPNLLSKFLGEWSRRPGKRWFARQPSFRPVRDQAHLDYLTDKYRAKHLLMRWREGEPPPPLEELIERGRGDGA